MEMVHGPHLRSKFVTSGVKNEKRRGKELHWNAGVMIQEESDDGIN